MSAYQADYPFRFDAAGRTARTEGCEHIRDMLYQVLFTNPGERVNRPDFGCGLLQMVFLPNSDALATATQFLVQGALQRWLGDVIRVESVEVSSENEKLIVDLVYICRATGQREQARLTAPIGGTP